MASFNIHLAIGKRYIEKNKTIKNEKEFYKGILEPDMENDKKISHYTGINDENNLLQCLLSKVQLNEYLKNKDIDSDYEKGVFLHLITDYLFFNAFFEINYLENVSYEKFFNDLYYSYDETNEYLSNKYNIDYSDFLGQITDNRKKFRTVKNDSNDDRINILPFYKVDNFIEYVSNIDLDNYKKKIIMNNSNVLP